jgi:hypothetical protein
MGLSHHQQQQHQLHRIEDDLLQSDPKLATTLQVFGMLSATEAMPAWEQVPTRQDRSGQAAAMTGKALAIVAAVGFLLSAILVLLIVVVQGCRPRLSARRHGRAGPGQVADGRQDPADRSLPPMSTITAPPARRPAAARRIH